MLEAEIVGIEVHLPGSAGRLAANLRLRGGRLLDDERLPAFARCLKRELRIRFECRSVSVRHPHAKRERDRSDYPDLNVRVKARPGHAGPTIYDRAAEGEVEIFVKEALLKYEDGVRRALRRGFWLRVAFGLAILAGIAWWLNKIGVL